MRIVGRGTIGQLQQATGGKLVTGANAHARISSIQNQPLNAIVTDSRLVQPGDIFWALRGEHHDASKFLGQAIQRGVAGCVVTQDVRVHADAETNAWRLEVEDANRTLADWATFIRRRCNGTVVGITGSVGKTTTRQMADAVLGARLRGSASPKNFNNRFGVPFSLLRIAEHDDYALIELGADGPGQIAGLAKMAEPDVGVITQVADAHLGPFGGRRGVLQAKLELLEHLATRDGQAVLADDTRLLDAADRLGVARVVVGESPRCDIRAGDVRNEHGRLKFVVEQTPYDVPSWGRHLLTSALCAIALGRLFGLKHAEMAEALRERYVAPPRRCNVRRIGEITVIDDTYNASPTAVRAALDLLAETPCLGRRVAVLGDMLDLGSESSTLHRAMGRYAVHKSADMLIACGAAARDFLAGAREAGSPQAQMHAFSDADEAAAVMNDLLGDGDVVLVKGSRAMRMERTVDALAHVSDATRQSQAERPLVG